MSDTVEGMLKHRLEVIFGLQSMGKYIAISVDMFSDMAIPLQSNRNRSLPTLRKFFHGQFASDYELLLPDIDRRLSRKWVG